MLLGGQHSIPGRLSIPNKTRFTDYFTEGTRRALGKAGMRTPARYLACRLSEGRGSSLEFAPLASGFPSPAPTLSGPIGICLFFLLFSQQPALPFLATSFAIACCPSLPWNPPLGCPVYLSPVCCQLFQLLVLGTLFPVYDLIKLLKLD